MTEFPHGPTSKHPDELPDGVEIDDLHPGFLPLVLDHYLSRKELVRRIGVQTGADVETDHRRHFSYGDLARIYRHHAGNAETRDIDDIRPVLSRNDIIRRLGTQFNFDTYDHQEYLRKSQTIHLLTRIATDKRLTAFELPADHGSPADTGKSPSDGPVPSRARGD